MGSRNTRNRERGERIRQLREEKGMTLVALSKAAGYKYSWQLSKVELDGVSPDPDRLQAIAEELGVSVEFLNTGVETRNATAPAAYDVESWLGALGEDAPDLALTMARTAWTMAHGEVRPARPAQTPTLTPPSRSATQSLVPPSASGMRAKKSAGKSVAPPAVKRRVAR